MPAGDAQRAWFPEMFEDLKSHWSRDMTWKELAVFCHDMTEKRQRIKEARNIRLPRMTCQKCGGRMVLPPISIRSALFALRKINAIDESEFKKLDREWGKHRKANGLDACGNRPKS
ncbi:MAG: hypothetical protein A2Z18_10400 [Armatimonadetes bacterium RBG_16_58_9]|nr:MAG: hypothetical protein A2Z18_10400 [Armatimonadetes bacterium RBG_16_58_9]